jgi:hypothetical protein
MKSYSACAAKSRAISFVDRKSELSKKQTRNVNWIFVIIDLLFDAVALG